MSYLLVALLALSTSASSFDVKLGENLILKLRTCNNDSCRRSHISKRISNLEVSRLQERIRQFKILDSTQWKQCNLKMRKLQSHEHCYYQTTPEGNQVRMIFSFEENSWRLQQLSLPSPAFE